MKVLTHDQVRVETGFAIESLRELEVSLVPGKHGTAWIRGFVDEEIATAKLQSQLKNSQIKVFEVDENGAQVGKPIFEGIVRDAEVGEENGYTEVKLNAVTGTILLDMEKKSRSFQDVSMTYRDVVKKVLEDTPGAHAIFTVGMDTKIEKPLIQFEETNWQFIRRLVSHFSSELIPEVEMCRPNFWFGMRESSATADFSDNMYDVHIDGKYYDMGGDAIGLKRADYLYYSVVDGQNLSIGNLVTFRDKSLIIGEKYAKFERGELLFHYKLCRPAYVGIKPYYNENVCGLSLAGTVRTTEKEVLYIDLDIDKDREKGVLYHYAWVPTTGNLMYCMPKIGTRVFLYIPDHDERHAMSTSCIRTNGKQHPQMAEYHNRYFTTEHYKQMNMLPESMALIGVGEQEKPLSITMHDSMGISVFSHKTIVLRAGNGISISGKNVIFKTQRDLRVVQGLGGTAKIEICNKIDVDAPKTNVKMTYHSASGRPQEKSSPDVGALAKILMFVIGSAIIQCVTAKTLGPIGAMIGSMATRILPRITTGSGQIMMVTGASVPVLSLGNLKKLMEAQKHALIDLEKSPYYNAILLLAKKQEEIEKAIQAAKDRMQKYVDGTLSKEQMLAALTDEVFMKEMLSYAFEHMANEGISRGNDGRMHSQPYVDDLIKLSNYIKTGEKPINWNPNTRVVVTFIPPEQYARAALIDGRSRILTDFPATIVDVFSVLGDIAKYSSRKLTYTSQYIGEEVAKNLNSEFSYGSIESLIEDGALEYLKNNDLDKLSNVSDKFSYGGSIFDVISDAKTGRDVDNSWKFTAKDPFMGLRVECRSDYNTGNWIDYDLTYYGAIASTPQMGGNAMFDVLYTGNKMDNLPSLTLDFSRLEEYLEHNGADVNKKWFYEEKFK